MRKHLALLACLAFAVDGATAGAIAADAPSMDAPATGAPAANATTAPAESGHPMSSADGQSMPYREMADLMQMDDTTRFAKVMLDQLEWRNADTGEGRSAWDAQAYYGGDYNKLWAKAEGKYASSGRTRLHDADVEVLWDRVISTWWNLQGGGRRDIGPGQSRTWAAVGIQGLAPQWFQTEAAVYASDEGRTAARLKAQYDLLLTQRLVLQPFIEANLYGRSEPAHQIGSGLSELEISIRLRYEVRREFAPYVGVVWLRKFGKTADFTRSAGESASDLELTAGLHVWL